MKKAPIGMKIDPELLLKVDLLAEEEKRTRSAMIEILVDEAVKEREEARVPA